ncbi:hypothetical protein F2Q69_00027793 [Brassica cretica]|uniref:Uncharacterized protein n=1 Tax=Brassica cretica TaxID=69181 RepID=A0A8S9S189_BRACR|nr:hypothetical protein F2Q69_00027793 [Brassica cretica]
MAIGPRTSQAQSLRSDRARTRLGRYIATELKPSSVATYRPSTYTARSLRSDQARTRLGRCVATKLSQNVDTTRIHAFSSTL